MNPNCNLCHGMGWYWAELTAYGKKGEFSRPCPECNPTVKAVWDEAGKQGRQVHKELEKQWEARTLPYPSDQTAYSSGDASALSCDICGGEVVEYSIPNDIWNHVIRTDGHEHDQEYLCIGCFYAALRVALKLVSK